MSAGSPRVRRFDRAASVYDSEALQRAVYRPAHDAVVAELRAAGSRRVVNPRTPAISRLLSRAGTRLLGAGFWPTRAQLRDEVASSGFEVSAQRGARDLAHTVVTVATARRADTGPVRHRRQEG